MLKQDLVTRNWQLWLESHNGQRFLAEAKKKAEQSKTSTTPVATTTNPPVKKA